jgi:hypothetical protein
MARRVLAVLAAGLLALLAGCGGAGSLARGGSGGGNAGAGRAPRTSSPPSTSRNLYGAPHVAHPLDVSRFLKKPCSVLSHRQIQHLHKTIEMATGTKPGGIGGPEPGCSLVGGTNAAHEYGGSWSFLTDGYGLASVYSQRSSFGVFKPLGRLHGYPALIAFAAPSDVRCTVGVGVSDKLAVTFTMKVGLNPPVKPCTATKKLAAAAVATMKKGSGS